MRMTEGDLVKVTVINSPVASIFIHFIWIRFIPVQYMELMDRVVLFLKEPQQNLILKAIQ